MKKNRKIILIFVFIFLAGIIFIQALTKEELELKKGININNKIEIGDRTFYPIDNNGYVQLINTHSDKSVVFKTRNTRITTKDGVEIITSGEDTYIIFKSAFSGDSYNNYIQIDGEKLKIKGSELKVDKTNKDFLKFVLDKNGEFIEGTKFKLVENSVLNHKNKKYELLKGTLVTFEKDNIIFEGNVDGTIAIDEKEFEVKDSEKSFKFIVDKEGKILQGSSFTTKEAEYILRGYKIVLPEDSVVEYLEDRVVIRVPPGSDVKPSVEDVVKDILEITTKEPGALVTPSGNFQVLEEVSQGNYRITKTSIFYKYENNKLKSYFKDKVAVFLNDKNEVEFSIVNTKFGEGSEIELVFDNKGEISNSAVIVTNNIIGSFSKQGQGVIINILAGNKLGVGMNTQGISELLPGKKTLSFQGIDGFAILNKGDEGKIPVLQISGNSIYAPDKKSFFGYNEQFYYNPSTLIAEVSHGDSTVPIRTVLIDAQGKQIPVEIFSTNENAYAFVPSGQMKSPLEYYQATQGVVVSSSVVFNQLSPNSRQIYTELIQDEQNKFVQETLQQGGIAALERQLSQIEMQRSPLRASVTLSGCSGTIVGYRGDKAYIMTADHCVGRVGSYKSIWLNSLVSGGGTYESGFSEKRYDDREVTAKVVATTSRTDVTLLEVPLTEEVRKRGYVRIPNDPDYAKKGDNVMRIGCPGARSSYRQTSCVVRSVYKNPNDWDSINVRGPGAIGGESGGGLFKGRYLVGTLSTGHGFGNLYAIHELLKKNGYDFLITNLILIMSGIKTTFFRTSEIFQKISDMW